MTISIRSDASGIYGALQLNGSDVATFNSTGFQNVVPVRQTVLSGPVDSSGFSAFGGSTGSTTVTASGTLKASAAAGGDVNYTGSITNPSWTGLSTNGTMYLYLDITSGGVVTTGSSTLAPTYQWGGTYSTTNGQHTYNVQEMTMKAGNGSTASQVYRVFVGEVTVAGGVVTAITWYALMGRYDSGLFSVAVSTGYAKAHNVGIQNLVYTLNFSDDAAGTSERPFLAGITTYNGATTQGAYASAVSRNSITLTTSANAVGYTLANAAAATGYYRLKARRDW